MKKLLPQTFNDEESMILFLEMVSSQQLQYTIITF